MTVGEYKVQNEKIANYMEWEVTTMETECGVWDCRAKLSLGDEIVYDKNYNAYCDNKSCGEGIAIHHTVLEECWWGEEYYDLNSLNFQSDWSNLFLVLKKFDEDGKYTDALKLAVIKGDIKTVYKTVCESI